MEILDIIHKINEKSTHSMVLVKVEGHMSKVGMGEQKSPGKKL
jgi:hypothetical protein